MLERFGPFRLAGGPRVRIAVAVFGFALWGLTGCSGSGDDAAAPEAEVGSELSAAAEELLDALRAPEPDKVVARVNGEAILAGEVYDAAAFRQLAAEAEGQTFTAAQAKNFRIMLLGLMVDDLILRQAAAERGVTVEDAAVETELQKLRDQFGTAEQWSANLAEQGIDEAEIEDAVRNRLVQQRFRDHLIEGIRVTEEEARQFYDDNPERFLEGETVDVRQVLIASRAGDPPARREQARRRAEEAHSRAMGGEAVADLAKEYSQTPNASKGGLVPGLPRGAAVPKFEEVAFALERGEISEVFEIPQGFTFVEKVSHKEPTPIPFAEIKPQLMIELNKVKQDGMIAMALTQLRSESTIELLDDDFKVDDTEAADTADGAGEAQAG